MNLRRSLAIALVLAAAVGFVVGGGWSFFNDGDRVEEFFTERGLLGPVVFIAAMWVLQPAGLPGALFMVPAAVVWPLPTAMALSWIGNMGASTIAFAVARWFAHDWAQARLPDRLKTWDARLAGGTTVQVTWQVTLLRFLTGQLPPADWLLGVSTVSMRAFLIGTGIGIIPGIVLVTTVGGGLVGLLGDRSVRLAFFGVLIALGVTRRVLRRRGATAVSRGRERPSGADAPR